MSLKNKKNKERKMLAVAPFLVFIDLNEFFRDIL